MVLALNKLSKFNMSLNKEAKTKAILTLKTCDKKKNIVLIQKGFLLFFSFLFFSLFFFFFNYR